MSPIPQDAPRIRISDADRERAIDSLGEHYASGRLDKDEYDARLEQGWAAKFQSDLDALFVDLPRRERAMATSWNQRPGTASPRVESPRRRPTSARPFSRSGSPFLLLPALTIVGAAIVFGAPWLLFALFWVFACGGRWRRHAATSHRW
jgi:hypothetical protein